MDGDKQVITSCCIKECCDNIVYELMRWQVTHDHMPLIGYLIGLLVYSNETGPYSKHAESVFEFPLYLCLPKCDQLLLCTKRNDAGEGGVSLMH